MVEDIKGDTSGDYRDLLIGLCTPYYHYRAEQLHKAVAGIGTDEGAIIDILAHASNAEIQQISLAYTHAYGKSLLSDVKGDTSGHFKKALEYVLEGKRDEGLPYDPARVESDAHKIHEKGEGKFGTDDDFFAKFFTKNPFPHIFAVDNIYRQRHGHGLAKACEKELSGSFGKFLIAMATPKPQYWAERLHHAFAGVGTKDDLLKRAFILNNPQEIHQIGEIYKKMFGNSLSHDTEKETSGNYKKTLEALLKRAGL
eukprot:Phypoly_transcript_13216.p1 GENE.Phypoly_transcript_13216~~Phypoly_transcript_13216.p1  ORF type:complete len:255 (-),score=72.23 Phypoly_transcript_13216:39-803(-)